MPYRFQYSISIYCRTKRVWYFGDSGLNSSAPDLMAVCNPAAVTECNEKIRGQDIPRNAKSMFLTNVPYRLGRKHHLFLNLCHVIAKTHDPENSFSPMDNVSTVLSAIGSYIAVDVPILPISFALMNPTYRFPVPRQRPSCRFFASLFCFNFSPPRSNYGTFRSIPFYLQGSWNIKISFLLEKNPLYRLCIFEF